MTIKYHILHQRLGPCCIKKEMQDMILLVVPQIDGLVGVMLGTTLGNHRDREPLCRDAVSCHVRLPYFERVHGLQHDLLQQERHARQRLSQLSCLKISV